MSSKGIIKPAPRLTSIHNLRSTKQTTSLNLNKAAKPVKIDRLSSLPSELVLLVFEHLRTRPGKCLNRWTTALLSKSLRPFQQLNLYFSIDINSVKMLKSLCASLRISKLGTMIKHISFNINFGEVESEDIVTKALARLAKLVPRKFQNLIYEQAIDAIYQSEMNWRVEDQMEGMEDYFDGEVEEMIILQAHEDVEEHYDYDTDWMIEEMVSDEQQRLLRKYGREISARKAKLSKANLEYDIEEMRRDRKRYKKQSIQATREDEYEMEEKRDFAREWHAEGFKDYLMNEERDRIREELDDDMGDELRQRATWRAQRMFNVR